MNTVTMLDGSHVDEVIAVMGDAFLDYPVMRFVVGPEGDVEARIHRLVRLFVARRVRRGGPMLGIHDNGRLVGAAVLTSLHEPDPPADTTDITEAAWRDLGEPARARYQTYADATSDFFSKVGPHYHLNMIGIRQSHMGRGLATPLMRAVREMHAQDPESTGVSLTTERARNVTLYQHFGYRVVAHREVTPDLETWGLVTT